MTKHTNETILSTLEGESDREQLLVVLCNDFERGSRIELRQQSWGDGIGWFTQNTVRLEPHQVAQLRGALGGGCHSSSSQPKNLSQEYCQEPHYLTFPRIAQAETA